MLRVSVIAMVLLLCLSAASNIERTRFQTPSQLGSGGIEGKVLRSDSNEAISNSYILLMQEKGSRAQAEHFDVRTNEQGAYRFKDIPAGKYTVSIYAWFRNKSDVPCQNPSKAATLDGGTVTVEWQRKSGAFMEIVTVKAYSVGAGQNKVKDFDLVCK